MFGISVEKLEKMAGKKKSGKIIKYVDSKDKTIRDAAIKALGKCGDDDSYNKVIMLLNSGDTDVRIAAARALGEMERPQAATHLTHAIKTETDSRVLAALKTAMQNVHSKAEHLS